MACDLYGLLSLLSNIIYKDIYADFGAITHKKAPCNCLLVNHPVGLNVSNPVPPQYLIYISIPTGLSKDSKFNRISFNESTPIIIPHKLYPLDKPSTLVSIIWFPDT